MAEKESRFKDVDTVVSVTPSKLVHYYEKLIPKQKTVMVWGGVGIGKTGITRKWLAKYGHRIVPIHLSQFDPTDVKGLPVLLPNGRVAYVPTAFLPRNLKHTVGNDPVMVFNYDFPFAEEIAIRIYDKNGDIIGRHNDQMYGPNDTEQRDGWTVTVNDPKSRVTVTLNNLSRWVGCVVEIMDKAAIFFDEINQGVTETQNAVTTFLSDRRALEYVVPDNCPIICAGNRESDKAFVFEMSAPVANRMFHLILVPSVPDFVDHAYNMGWHPLIPSFVESYKDEALYGLIPELLRDGKMGFRSPRSWENYADCFDPNWTDTEFNVMTQGWLGAALIPPMKTFMKLFADMRKIVADILNGNDVQLPDTANISIRHIMMSAITEELCRRSVTKYDRDAVQQSQEWIDTAENFITFIHNKLGKELTTASLRIMINRHKVRLAILQCAPSFSTGFSATYAPILERMVGFKK